MPSNNHFAVWEGGFLMGKETTYGTVASTFKAMPVTGEPTLDAAPEFVDSGETGRGRAERFYSEFGVGRKKAALSFETDLNETRLYHFLRSLFQAEGTKTGTGPYTFTWNPYTAQPTTNLGYSFQKVSRQGATDAALQSLGVIVSETKLSSAGGQFAKAGLAAIGTTATHENAGTAANAWDGEVVLMHHNAYCKVTPQGGSEATLDPESLECTVGNGLQPWYGVSQTPNDLVLGVMAIGGGFQVSAKAGMVGTLWDDLLARNSIKVVLGWGTPAAAGNIELTYDAVYESGAFGNVNGIQTLTFNHRQAKRVTVTSVAITATADLSV